MRPFSVDVSESIRFGFRSLTSRPVDFLKQASLPLAVSLMAGIALVKFVPRHFPPFGLIPCIVAAVILVTAFFSMTWIQQAAGERIEPRRFGAFMLTGVLVFLSVSASFTVSAVAVSALIGSGFPSLAVFTAAIVANFALYLRLAFTPVAAALGDTHPIRTSWDLTRGRELRILISAAAPIFIGYVIAAVLNLVGIIVSAHLEAALDYLVVLIVNSLQLSTALNLYRRAQTEIIY